MKTLYLDIFSGISGDMFIGALLDLGVDFAALEHELEKLGLDEFHLHTARAQKSSIEGVKFDVHLHHHDHDHDHHHEEGHEHGHHEDEHEHAHSHGHSHPHNHGHAHAHEGEDHHHHDHGHDHHHHHDDDEHDHEHEHEHGRSYADIRALIQRSSLSSWVKERALAILERIAQAEGKIHGVPPAEVHFHEVGAVDSIVDIVGACIALDQLGRPRVRAAQVIDGQGFVNCAHGRFPIPVPATLNILAARGVSISQCDEPHEMITPTGAALLAELAESFGPLRDLKIERVGYGLGTRDHRTRPNVLRALLGQESASDAAHDWEQDTVVLLETNLDDVNAEVLGYTAEKAMAQGALDVFHTPIQMKKGRPGVLFSILCEPSRRAEFTELILRETTTLGVRESVLERHKLRRSVVTVSTPHGPIPVKVGQLNGRVVQAAPEYEACRAAAEAHQVPLKEVYRSAEEAFRIQQAKLA